MRQLRKSQSFIAFEQPDQARFEKTRALFGYWQRLQAGGRPSRASLEPLDMKPYLANLLTGNIEPQPFRVLYKLVGTLVADYSQYDFSCRYLDELGYSGRDDVDWESSYRHVHAARQLCRDRGL